MIADNTLLTQPEGHQIMDQTRYQWNTNTSDDSRSVVPDTEQNLAPSIFDDVRSDDNELYIVWSDPSLPLQRVASASGIETPPSSTDPAVTTISVAAAATSSIMHPLAAKSTHSASASSSASGAVLVLGEAAAQSMHSKAATTPCDPISVSTSCERFVNRRWSVGEGDHAIEQERTKDAMSRDPMLKQHTCDDVSPLTLSTAGPVESSAALNSPKRVLKSTSRTENAQEVVMTGTSTQSRDQGNRVIMAATVEKLVEKLTSEIDYTFLTDFFLIYRLFITPMALLNLFILRFQWALIDDSPQRQIVRIRTFVTLRHWLLNYFGFDFMRSKKLRQALNVHLRALSKHPLVIDSPRDGRIVMELRRYAQSLKKIHYRTIAQKKQERQNRRQEEQRSRQLQSRKIPIVGREASSAEWSAVSSSEFAFHQPQFSSGPSSAMAQDVTDQHSVVSETMTEVLTVEFHSSDQSDDVYDDDAGEDSEMEDSEDDFELSSDSNSFYTSDDGSEYSTPADEEHTQEGYRTHGDGQEARTRGGFTSGSESDSDYHASYKYASRRETASMNECHLPSPTFSPPAHKDGSGVSIQSQRQTRSAISSTASRLQSRPTLPDFAQLGQSQATSFGLPNSKERHNVGRHRWSVNKAAQPQPLSPIHVATSPPSHGLPSLTTQSSLRSIEPYINPPPRPIAFSEKKKIWTRYMNATVGRLSKMKNAFSSNANKKRRHSHSSSSILSGGSKRTGSGTSQTRPRYWYGNRSDPEGEKLSHYLLRSCTGMNLLLSSSEDRRISIDRRLAAERDQQREEAGSDWSSDDDYSQYEMTRQSSRQLHSQGGQEAEQGAIEPQALETRLEQAQYPPYVDLTSFTDTSLIADAGGGLERDFCVECERERLFSKPCHPLQMVSPITTNRDMIAYDGRYGPETPLAAEPDGGRKDAFPSEVDPSTPTRTHQVPFERHDLDHRDSWMSFSSASMSATDHTASGPKSPMSQDQTRSDAVEQHSGDPQASSHGHDPLQTASRVEPSSADHGSDPSGSTVHVSSPRRVLLLDSKRRTLPPIPLGQQYHQYYRHYYTATPAGMTRDEQFHTLRILHRRYSSGMQAMEDWGQMKGNTDRDHLAVHLPAVTSALAALQSDASRQNESLPLQVQRAEMAGPSVPSSASALTPVSMPVLLHRRASQLAAPAPIQSTLLSRGRSRSHPHLYDLFSDSSTTVSRQQRQGPKQDGKLSAAPSPAAAALATLASASVSCCHHGRGLRPAVAPPPFGSGSAAPTITTNRAICNLHDSCRSGLSQRRRSQPPLTTQFRRHHHHHRHHRSLLDPCPIVTLKESCALPLVLRYRSELIAQQMCLIERELLNQIQWYEMVDAGWTKKVNSSTGARSNNKESQNRGRRATMGDITAEISATRAAHNMMREGDSVTGGQANWIRNETVECSAGTAAPTPGAERCRGSGDGMNRRQSVSKRDESLGIKRLVERFNLTCQWVACEIVKTRDLEMRVKVVEKFIRIAHTCYNHSNFSSLIQVMLGLQALSVSRLSQTWSRVRAQEMNIMHDLIEFTLPFHNWKHLREAMKNIADEWGGSSSRGAGASCSSTPVSPVSEKPQSSGTGFFSRRSSKSMATMGVKATKEAFRRPSTTTIFDENNTTVTTPTTFIPATSHLSSSPFQSSSSKRRGTWSSGMPLMPTASVSTSGKGKDKKDKETEKSGQQGGCIPFLGLYLSDLVFNSELPSYVDPAGYSSSSTSTSTSTPAHQIPEHRRLVNMHKHRTTATIIKRVLTFRTMASRYPFLPEPEVQRLLRNIQGADADDMLRRSKLCEERATNSAR